MRYLIILFILSSCDDSDTISIEYSLDKVNRKAWEGESAVENDTIK